MTTTRRIRAVPNGAVLLISATMSWAAAGCSCGDQRGGCGADTAAAGSQLTPVVESAAPATPAGRGGMVVLLTPQLVALGDSIFEGQAAGGTCMTCHGPDAKGTQLAPDLTDDQWLNVDGSYQAIVNVVQNGVPTPKKHPAPMPPMGGSSLTPDQVRAVAAYVYSLSHPEAAKGKS